MKPSRRALDSSHLGTRSGRFLGFLGAGLHASAGVGVTGTEAGAAQRSTSGDVAFEPPAWLRRAFRC